jgi:hypothetical protein
MAARAQNAKAKEKKQKIILAVGGVLLLAMLAIQLPKLMKHGGAATATNTASATVVVTATADGTAAAPAPAELTTFQNTDAALPASLEKLSSLSRFHAKDPFKQQATETTAAPGVQTPTSPAATGQPQHAAKAPAGAGPVFGMLELPATGGTTAAPTITTGLPAARLRINGKAVRIAIGRSFPASNPFFRLAGFGPGNVKIAVVRGSLADGSSTLTLRRRHPVTLVNTVNGGRYTIQFLATARVAS